MSKVTVSAELVLTVDIPERTVVLAFPASARPKLSDIKLEFPSLCGSTDLAKKTAYYDVDAAAALVKGVAEAEKKLREIEKELLPLFRHYHHAMQRAEAGQDYDDF